MAKRPKQPDKLVIGGKTFVLLVLRVESFREDGRPDEVSIVYPDDVAELSTDTTKNVFLTGYLHRDSTLPGREEAAANPPK